MSEDKTPNTFEFAFDPSLDFDPEGDYALLDEFDDDENFNPDEYIDTPGPFLPNDEGRTEFLPPDPDWDPGIKGVEQDSGAYTERPAIDRTRQLFAQLRAQRLILVEIVKTAETPVNMETIEASIADVRKRRFSIYSTPNLCSMLETAGGLERVREDGSPYGDGKGEPDIVVEDGEEYYVPTNPPVVHWLATDAGKEISAEALGTIARVQELFDKEEKFLSIYKRVLTMAAREEGATMPQLSAAEDTNPLIAKPTRRFFVAHFVENLERRGGIMWGGKSWVITDLGREALELLDDVVDDFESGVEPKTGQVATTTQGVNW